MPTASYLLLPWFATAGTTALTEGRGNAVRLMSIFIPADITVSRIVGMAAVSVTGDSWGFGLYTPDGDLVLDSGPITMATSSTDELLAAAITPVLVERGRYWLGWSGDSLTSSLLAGRIDNLAANIMCLQESIVGDAANPSSGGQLPATTGAITTPAIPGTDQVGPFLKLQA